MRGAHARPRRHEGIRKHVAWWTVLVTALALVAIQMPAMAVHTYDYLELDRNAVDDISDAVVDWENIGSGSFVETAFIQDPPTAAGADDIYTIGSTKDDLDLDGWHYKTGNVPDKDDLTNAYAAAISDEGEMLLYFGADRYANRGDAEIGFWFLQQEVHMRDGRFMTPDPITGDFTLATHQEGDILVLSDFTKGGRVSTISVYEWVGTGGDTNGTLNLIATGADCVDQGTGLEDLVCGTVNIETEYAPWDFTPKFPDKNATGNHFPAGSFYEGGVNLTALGVEAGCFSTFIAETRSSQSVDAILKDVVLGRGDLCSIEVEKEGPELSKIGDEVAYDYVVTNTGALPLYLESIVDDQVGDLTALALGCEILAPGATCTFTVPWVVPPDATDPYPNEVFVVYRDHIENGVPYGAVVVGSASWEINLFQPDYSLVKDGTELSKVGDEVIYTFTFENLSSDDAPPLVLMSMDDTVLGDLMADATTCATLVYGETCSFDVSYIVPEDAPDPLDNTVTAVMSPEGFPNELPREASHSVNLFQPDFMVEKTGDELSKIGDDVTYTFEVSNLSSDDAPALELVSMGDTVLGDLTATAIAAGCGSLAYGESCVFDVGFEIPEGAPDPMPNTVTVVMSPDGFPNMLERSDGHEVNLFQPSIELTKTGSELSKIGDMVFYSFDLENTSSLDTPALECTVSDPMIGFEGQAYLTPGSAGGWSVLFEVPVDASDPMVNTATATCSPEGFPNVLTTTATWSINLFQPDFEVTKSGTELSKVGDWVTYDFLVMNTSSDDAPALEMVEMADTVLGDLTSVAIAAGCGTLEFGEVCTFSMDYLVPDGAPDPLMNHVDVVMSPIGFPNMLERGADHEVNLFQPDYSLTKTGTELSKIGDDVTYTFTLENLSSDDAPALELVSIHDSELGDLMVDASACGVLASGEVCSFDAAYTVPDGSPDPLINTVIAVMSPEGFPNLLEREASHSVNLFQPDFMVEKTGDELSKIGDDVTYTFKVTNLSSDDAPALELVSMDDTVLGDLTATANAAGCDSLAYGESCVFDVEFEIPEGAPDPMPNTVTVVMSPDGFPNMLERSDGHEVNLFQPAIVLEKTGDELSKIGDEVTYHFELFNTSSADTPPLVCTITDPMIGFEAQTVLASSTSEGWTATFVIPLDANDPMFNTASASCSPEGFPNVIETTATWSINLFQPGFEVMKSGTELSKVGDYVTYDFRIENTSSDDAPALELIDVHDSVLGDLDALAAAAGCDSLLSGEACEFSAEYLVPDGAPDPLMNHVHVIMSPAGFPNMLESGADHEVNLFQPDYSLTKTGTELSKIGDEVTYTFTFENLSSDDAPDLELTYLDDSVLGDLMVEAAAAGCDILTYGEVCSFDVLFEVPVDAPDPMINTVMSIMSPLGFPNLLERFDSHEVNLFQPNYSLTCATADDAYYVMDDVCYEFTVTNLSSPDTPPLVLISANDTLLGNLSSAFVSAGADVLSDGESTTVMFYRTVLGTDPSRLMNTLVTVYSPDGFPNLLERTAMCEYDIIFGCALSPGFWGGGEGYDKWNQLQDPVAIAAGFTTDTVFPWLDPSLAGSTYYDVLKLPAEGDVTRQLAFKYIAATLNEAAPGIGVPADTALLLDEIEAYFAANPVGSDPQGAAYDHGMDLKTQLDTYFFVVGEEHCPSPGTIPEY